MAFSGSNPSQPQINMTPLIDVLLTIIIIFMVAVSLQKEKGLDAEVPQPSADEAKTPSPRTIVVQVIEGTSGDRARLKINQEEVRWEDLNDRLQKIFLQRAERVAFVKGDGDLDFEVVANVIDIMHHSGAEKVGLLTKGGVEM